MYNDIEALEKNLTRKPASKEMDELFSLPKAASKWDDLNDTTLTAPPAKGEGDKIVGGVDPDFTGYDDLISKVKGLKPRDTSMMDLANRGVSTLVGVLGGRASVGMKNAGEYGLDRFNKQEKRADDMESLLMKIQMDKAAKMAAGKKGVKVKGAGGGNADDPTKNRYLGADGYLHTPTRKRSDGTWAQLETDPVYDKPSAQVITVGTSDGGTVNILKDKNKGLSIGSQNAPAQLVKDAQGNMVPVNTRTVLQSGLPQDFNKTEIGTSPTAKKTYDKISSQYRTDANLARYQQAESDIRAAAAALGSDGELSPAFLLSAQRFLGMGMDKGRSLTNDEFAKVEGVNTGWADKIRNMIIGYKEGKVSSDEVRQEYRKLAALLGTNVSQLRNERIQGYNQQLKDGMGTEFKPELAFPAVGGLTAKKQDSDVKKVEKLSGELRSDKPKVFDYEEKLPNGTVKKRKVKMGFNPKTGKYDRYLGDE